MPKFLDVQRAFSRWGRSGIIFNVLVGLAALLFAGCLGAGVKMAFAHSYCSSTSRTVVVQRGDTLSSVAARYHTNWRAVAKHNHITDPDHIYSGRMLCIPYAWSNGHSSNPTGVTVVARTKAMRGQRDAFPYGQCTWWASERYHQLTGAYVPWTTQSDAWQWTTRAYQFNWKVSNQPTVGAIMDLQPWVQGAYALGHVAVVESILPNGHVIASSMNWGSNPDQVTRGEFTPGPGVTFITI